MPAVQVIRFFLDCGSIRLARKNTLFFIHYPRFPKQRPRKQFHIETDFSNELFRNRAIEIHIHQYTVFFSLDRNLIRKLKIRINHRIKSFQMTIHIRITQFCGYGVLFSIKLSFTLFGNRLPLTRCLFKTDVPVCCHSVSMHDNAHTRLMTYRINIVKGHDIHALVLKIAGRCVQLKPVFSFQHILPSFLC